MPSSASEPGEVEKEMNDPDAPALVSTIASPWHEDAHPGWQRPQCVHEIVKPDGLQRNVGFAFRIDVDRHEIILAVDLQPVAGIEYQRHRVGSAASDLGGEFADRLAHVVLRQIGSRGYVEAGTGEQFRHSLGVVLSGGTVR